MNSALRIIDTQPAGPRFRALDGIRGIAALLVVFLHVEWTNHITNTLFIQNGYLAVDLFFILSGVVISANYSTRITDTRSSLRFLGLRFFRIYPLHFAMLVAFVAVECLKVLAQSSLGLVPEHPSFTGGQSPQSLLTHVFLVQGFGILPTPGWNGVSWSISCEFFAYILFAALTIFGAFRNRTFLIIGAIATLLVYAALGLSRGTLNVVFDLGYLRCIAGFFWGVLIERWSLSTSFHNLKLVRITELGVLAAILIVMAAVSGPAIVIIIPLFILMIALLRSDKGPVARILMAAPIQYLGAISYSVYMVHEFIILSLLMTLKRVAPVAYAPMMQRSVLVINPWIGDALVLLILPAVVVTASWTYQWVERPGRSFGRKLFGRPAVEGVGIAPPRQPVVRASAPYVPAPSSEQ